jgi:putative redox protein
VIRATVQWIGSESGDGAFTGTSGSGHTLQIGEVQGGAGTPPLELVALALGGCIATDVVLILRKKHQHVVEYAVDVEAIEQLKPPNVFTCVRVHHRLRGQGLKREAVRHAIDLSARSYSAVAAMLEKSVPIEQSFEIAEE